MCTLIYFMFYGNRWVDLTISPRRILGTLPIAYKGVRVVHDEKRT